MINDNFRLGESRFDADDSELLGSSCALHDIFCDDSVITCQPVASHQNHVSFDESSRNIFKSDQFKNFLLGVAYINYLSSDDVVEKLTPDDVINKIMNHDADSNYNGNLSKEQLLLLAKINFSKLFEDLSEDNIFINLESVLTKLRPDIVTRGEKYSNRLLSFLQKNYYKVRYGDDLRYRLVRLSSVLIFHNILQDWFCIGLCRLLSTYELDSESVGRLIWDRLKGR